MMIPAVINKSSKKQHVAVLAFPFGCHAKPVLNLVCRLANAAPNICFSFLNTKKSNDSLFRESKSHISDNIKAYNVSDGVPKNLVFKGNPLEAVELFLKAAPESFKMGIKKAVAEAGERITCLVTDGFLVFAAEMAQNLGVPWIPVWIPLPCTLSTHIYTDFIRQHYANVGGTCSNASGDDGGDGLWLEDRTLEVIPGLSTMRIADLPKEVLVPSESLFSRMLSEIGQLLPQSTAIVMNFYAELNPTLLNIDLKSKFPNFLNVGFLTLSLQLPPVPRLDSDATGCLSWLDEQEGSSVAYVSFGTVGAPPQKELIALAEALEASGVPFLWSLTDNIKDLLPNGFVERTKTHGKIVPWAPQTQVLAHTSIGLFVTHCGCNSVYESIANGVPMICRPLFGDHRMTGRMVEEVWGIGLKIEGGVFTKSGVLKSLELILASEQGKKMREKAQALKEVVAEVAGPSGSAVQDFKTLVDVISSPSICEKLMRGQQIRS